MPREAEGGFAGAPAPRLDVPADAGQPPTITDRASDCAHEPGDGASDSEPMHAPAPEEDPMTQAQAIDVSAATPQPSERPEDLRELARTRLAVEGVEPEIDGGRFAAKCVAGRPMRVEADAFSDGHEVMRLACRWRPEGGEWTEVEMAMIVNDRWGCEITMPVPGYYEYSFLAWRDLFGTWHRDTAKKLAAGQDVPVEHVEGKLLVEAAMEETPAEAPALKRLLEAADDSVEPLMAPEAVALMRRTERRANLSEYPKVLPLFADREAAAFSAWYEMLPRSQGPEGRHGTFRDVIGKLDYVRGLGFDVLYFPPIHPIGKTNRKGKNNTLNAGPDDIGSPYAIGSAEGGFTDVHPELGTLDDFDALVSAARGKGLELALDLALNASPDHPWIEEHPDWFERRPDGTIKYAENPPKKYEDIVNFRYYLDDGRPNAPFWEAVRDIVLFWIDHGVLMFRVDNPHTKPFPFWEWIIREVRTQHPGAVFLSEAFTRPKVMKRLAKVGFSQSYSYFTWRNDKAGLTEYLTELTTEECRHTMRPNFFVNTPDINPYFLQSSGRPGFRTRTLLAASLSGSYGIYNGIEICEGTAMPGKEEYLDSEKYQLRHWDFDQPGNIQDDIRLFNRLRAERPAMRDFTNLKFYAAGHDQVLYYGRMDMEAQDYLIFHVLIDPQNPASFAFEVPLWEFGLPDEASVEVEDAIHGNRFTWHGKTQLLELEPRGRPYAIWRLLPPGAPR
jgi:starch synthase (maltosyl-transferring)